MISGSRNIKTLNPEVINSLNKIIELEFEIIIGDCYGIDTLIQRYLKSRNYQKVTVYHIGNHPRNNLGFNTVKVQGKSYKDKDIAMCRIANYGLAIWDGSRGIIYYARTGTLANINRVKKTKIIRF